jgi:integrase
MKLTQASIERLALPAGKSEAIIFDDDVPGFGLRIREGGSRTFIVQYALGGRQRRMTIGTAKILDAAKARQTARNLLARVRLGHDPAAERTEARVRASDEPLGAIIGHFLARQERRLRPRSYDDTRRYLERYLKPLHELHLASINRATVAVRLGKIANEHGPVSADRARGVLSSFFAWAIGEGLCDTNPVIGTNKHFDGAKSRDRVLTDRELAVIWKALPDSDYGAIVRLLILTGQRREEIGAMRWSEIDFKERLIALPPARTKNNRRHDVPLSQAAVAILKSHHARVESKRLRAHRDWRSACTQHSSGSSADRRRSVARYRPAAGCLERAGRSTGGIRGVPYLRRRCGTAHHEAKAGPGCRSHNTAAIDAGA